LFGRIGSVNLLQRECESPPFFSCHFSLPSFNSVTRIFSSFSPLFNQLLTGPMRLRFLPHFSFYPEDVSLRRGDPFSSDSDILNIFLFSDALSFLFPPVPLRSCLWQGKPFILPRRLAAPTSAGWPLMTALLLPLK